MSVFKKASVFVDKKGKEHKITRPFESTGGKPPNSNALQDSEWVRKKIPQENGLAPLPSLADQWKEDYRKRYCKNERRFNKNTRKFRSR